MADTLHHYDARDRAERRLKEIDNARIRYWHKIDAALTDLASEVGASLPDLLHAREYIREALDDLIFDARRQLENERTAADERIARIEGADLQRSRPVL